MSLKEFITKENERFDKEFKCINSNCDGNGYLPYPIEDGQWEADQCQFHAEYLFPMKKFIHSSILRYREALKEEIISGCPLIEELKVEKEHLWVKIPNTFDEEEYVILPTSLLDNSLKE